VNRPKNYKLKVGDHVLVSGQTISKRIKDKRQVYKEDFKKPVKCVFLGWSRIHEGNIESDSDWSEWSGPSTWHYFVPKKGFKVAMLTRLNYKGNRYYKPIMATLDQMSLGGG
jgi:hypothetical protein